MVVETRRLVAARGRVRSSECASNRAVAVRTVQIMRVPCHARPPTPPIDIARKPRETLSGDGLKGHHPSKFFAHFPS